MTSLYLFQYLGINILMVGVMGPNAPCEEVHIKHKGRFQYHVSYLVRERGDYLLIVKWGDDHIPGSPFQVKVNWTHCVKTLVLCLFT